VTLSVASDLASLPIALRLYLPEPWANDKTVHNAIHIEMTQGGGDQRNSERGRASATSVPRLTGGSRVTANQSSCGHEAR
jgi:hypothetical protein